jgi:hypothetical protein
MQRSGYFTRAATSFGGIAACRSRTDSASGHGAFGAFSADSLAAAVLVRSYERASAEKRRISERHCMNTFYKGENDHDRHESARDMEIIVIQT